MHHISPQLLFPEADTGKKTFSVSRQAVLNENIKIGFQGDPSPETSHLYCAKNFGRLIK